MNRLKQYENLVVHPELINAIPNAHYVADLPVAEEIVFQVGFPRFISPAVRKSLIPSVVNMLNALTQNHVIDSRKTAVTKNREENLYAGLSKDTEMAVQICLENGEVYSFLDQYKASFYNSSVVPIYWAWEPEPINAAVAKKSMKNTYSADENFVKQMTPLWCIASMNWEDFNNLAPELYDLTFPLIQARLVLSIRLRVGVRLPEEDALPAVKLWEKAIGLKI
jgi:hypothetical protein